MTPDEASEALSNIKYPPHRLDLRREGRHIARCIKQFPNAIGAAAHSISRLRDRCDDSAGFAYDAARLCGRCANGSELDGGVIFHAVVHGMGTAVCGVAPGRRSAGWSDHLGEAVTCPKCLKGVRP